MKPLGPAAPLPVETIRALRSILRRERRLRDLTLLNVHFDTCLRAGDLLSLRVRDVESGTFYMREEKTNKVTKCVLLFEARRVVQRYLATRSVACGAEYLFPSRHSVDRPMTVRGYQLIVKDWVALLKQSGVPLPSAYISTHSFRRSKPTYLYQQSHDIIACQRLLNHSKLDTTLKYLMVDADAGHELAARYPV